MDTPRNYTTKDVGTVVHYRGVKLMIAPFTTCPACYFGSGSIRLCHEIGCLTRPRGAKYRIMFVQLEDL